MEQNKPDCGLFPIAVNVGRVRQSSGSFVAGELDFPRISANSDSVTIMRKKEDTVWSSLSRRGIVRRRELGFRAASKKSERLDRARFASDFSRTSSFSIGLRGETKIIYDARVMFGRKFPPRLRTSRLRRARTATRFIDPS